MQEKDCTTCGRKFRSEEDYLKETSQWRLCQKEYFWFNCSCHSTLIVKSGPWSRSAVENQLRGKAHTVLTMLSKRKMVPYIPHAMLRLLIKIDDAKADAKALSEIAKQDPVFACDVMQHANSMSPDGPIESLDHAISYVGVGVLKNLVLLASVKEFQLKTKFFNRDEFWLESFLIAEIACRLNEKFELKIPADKVYLAGAMCNLGKVVYALANPEAADDLCFAIKNPQRPLYWIKGEKLKDSLEHTVMGEVGAVIWGLPLYVVEACQLHHQVHSRNELTNLIALANQLAHWIRLAPSRIDQRILRTAAAKFNMLPEDQESFVNHQIELRRKDQAG